MEEKTFADLAQQYTPLTKGQLCAIFCAALDKATQGDFQQKQELLHKLELILENDNGESDTARMEEEIWQN